MGVEGRKAPPLPAPTETDTNTGGSEIGSRVTEKSQYILPEDGSPVTIATRRRGEKDGLGGLTSSKSQTSLLIEYFEGGKEGKSDSRRPSVRAKADQQMITYKSPSVKALANPPTQSEFNYRPTCEVTSP
jgi:hypothetical protein